LNLVIGLSVSNQRHASGRGNCDKTSAP
jgi:hypothetical protein